MTYQTPFQKEVIPSAFSKDTQRPSNQMNVVAIHMHPVLSISVKSAQALQGPSSHPHAWLTYRSCDQGERLETRADDRDSLPYNCRLPQGSMLSEATCRPSKSKPSTWTMGPAAFSVVPLPSLYWLNLITSSPFSRMICSMSISLSSNHLR